MTKYLQTIALIAVLAAGSFGVYLVIREDDTMCSADRRTCPCLKLLPENKDFGISYKAEGGKVTEVDVGGNKSRDGDPSPELADKFIGCLKALGGVDVVNYVKILTEPLGKIGNLWTRQPGIQISLRPKNEQETEILNNLQIGPISDLKWRVIETWCSQNQACVVCTPSTMDRDTAGVEIRLKEAASVKKEFWTDGWPKNVQAQDPSDPTQMIPVNTYQPWELVDAEGKRYLYRCEGS